MIAQSPQYTDAEKAEMKQQHDRAADGLVAAIPLAAPEPVGILPVPEGQPVTALFEPNSLTANAPDFHRNAAINVGAAVLALNYAQVKSVLEQVCTEKSTIDRALTFGHWLITTRMHMGLEGERVHTHAEFLEWKQKHGKDCIARTKAYWMEIVEGDPFRPPPVQGKLRTRWSEWKQLKEAGKPAGEPPTQRENQAPVIAEVGLLLLELNYTTVWPQVQLLSATCTRGSFCLRLLIAASLFLSLARCNALCTPSIVLSSTRCGLC